MSARHTPTSPSQSGPLHWFEWLPLAIGALAAVLLLEFARTHLLVELDAAALGTETQFDYGEGGGRSMCQDAADSALCVAAYDRAGRPPAILWLGNSQLPAINRRKPGDRTAPALLHAELKTQGQYLVTYAQPNANLFEHALTLQALLPRYDIHVVVLPVFLDDIREQGIRATVAAFLDDATTQARISSTPLWPLLAPSVAAAHVLDPEAAAGTPTLQKRFEDGLNDRLSELIPLWRRRPHLRGAFGIALHTLRNKVLNINAQTQRHVDSSVYREKLAVLEQMLADCQRRRVKVLLYVPPYRRDIPGPYVTSDYQRFKADMAALAERHGARYANLEDIVPGPLWGTIIDPIFGFEDYDFMHFTADGHHRHATAVAAELRPLLH